MSIDIVDHEPPSISVFGSRTLPHGPNTEYFRELFRYFADGPCYDGTSGKVSGQRTQKLTHPNKKWPTNQSSWITWSWLELIIKLG